MIYLIIKIGFFLLAAMGLGTGIGFYFRQATARRELDEIIGALRDTQAHVPKLESQIRSRDQRIEQLKADVEVWQAKLPDLTRQLDERQANLRDREKQIHMLEQRLELGGSDTGAVPSSSEGAERISELSEALGKERSVIEALRAELRAMREHVDTSTAELADLRALNKRSVNSEKATTKENDKLRAERDRLQKSIEVLGQQLTQTREAKERALADLREANEASQVPADLAATEVHAVDGHKTPAARTH